MYTYNFTYMSFDPGETTGVVGWDEKANPLYIDQLRIPSLVMFLRTVNPEPIEVIIGENFKMRPQMAKAFYWSDFPTVQVIGRLKLFAEWNSIEYVEQASTVLDSAQKWSGMKIPEKHSISHAPSAYNHGYFWLFNKGLIRPRALDM